MTAVEKKEPAAKKVEVSNEDFVRTYATAVREGHDRAWVCAELGLDEQRVTYRGMMLRKRGVRLPKLPTRSGALSKPVVSRLNGLIEDILNEKPAKARPSVDPDGFGDLKDIDDSDDDMPLAARHGLIPKNGAKTCSGCSAEVPGRTKKCQKCGGSAFERSRATV